MTLKEFNAWLDGFSESIDGSPTAKQWEKIQKRIKQIEPDKEIQIERIRERDYWYPRPWYPTWVSSGTTYGTGTSSSNISFNSQLENQAYEVGKFEATQ